MTQDVLYPLFERRQIAFDHIPDNSQVDAKVLVHDDISKPSGQGPDLSRVFRPEVLDKARQASPIIIKWCTTQV